MRSDRKRSDFLSVLSSQIHNPLKLFKDPWYEKCKALVTPGIRREEYVMYRNDKIRKVYSSFDHLIIDNLHLYDRIIRIVMFSKTGQLIDEGKLVYTSNTEISRDKYVMTPTRLYHIVTASKDSTAQELWMAFPNLDINSNKNLEEALPDIMKVDWYAFIFKYLAGKCKVRSFTEIQNSDLSNVQRLHTISEFDEDVTTFTYAHMDIENCFNKIRELIDWQLTVRHKFDSINSYAFVGDTYGRFFNSKFDYLFIIKGLDQFLLERKPIRGSYEEVENIVNDIIPTLKKWHDKVAQTKTHFFNEVMVSLCRHFLQEYGTNFVSAKRSSDDRIRSFVSITKIGKAYVVHEKTHELVTAKQLFSQKLTSSTEVDDIAKFLVTAGYYVYASRFEFDNMISLTDKLYLNGNVDDVVQHYDDKIKVGTSKSSVKSKLIEEYENTLDKVDDELFKYLYDRVLIREAV